MSVQPIPEGYHNVTPYLVVEDPGRLIEFLEQAFGAEEKERHHRPDGSIMHAEVKIGDSILMLAGASAQWPAKPMSLYLYVADIDAAYKRALAQGAKSLMEPADQFYGDRGAGITDPSGNSWWIATHIEDVSKEELRKRAIKFFHKAA
jgi:PhnB protein